MVEKDNGGSSLSNPLLGMLFSMILSAIVVAACVVVVRYWPLPVSVAPYFGGRVGLVWGAVVGAIIGLIIGYLTDESHFTEKSQY